MCRPVHIARAVMGFRYLLSLVTAISIASTSIAQCTNSIAFATVAAPTTNTPLVISTCTYQTEYNTITGVVAGATYTVTSSCGGYITVRRGTYNGAVVANGNTPLSFTAPVAGTYYLHFNTNAACGTATNCCTTTITCTSCAGPAPCAAVNIPSLPVTGQSLTCHSSNLISSLNASFCGSGSTLYLGGNEALYTVTPTTSANYQISYNGQSYSSIWVYSGACPAAGGLCQGSISGIGTSQSLTIAMTAGTTYWILFDTWPSPPSPCPGTFSIAVSTVPPPAVASDCNQAVNVCTNINFQIDPNGFGVTNEIPPLGSLGNPDYLGLDLAMSPWGTDNWGCLRSGELNSTWMVVNVLTGGSLTFTFGGLGTQTGFYDWIMYPYNTGTCAQVAANLVAPVRCNWNGVAFGGTGLAAPPPPGGDPTNYEPPLIVGTNTRWLICFSNWSSVTTAVPLQFGGTAVVSCSPLPIELLTFEASMEEHAVMLRWTTASELNASHFEVERSTDMLEWERIGSLHAMGSSSMAVDYAWKDEDAFTGTLFYRLRMVDHDETFAYSPVRTVIGPAHSPVCFPNPSDGVFIARVPKGSKIEVLDALGRQVTAHISAAGTDAIQVNIGHHVEGLYTVRVGGGSVLLTERMLVVRR